MRVSTSFFFGFILLLCIATASMAQGAVDCDQLRDKVSQLENLDINAMSPSIRQLYKQSILKLYVEFGACIQRDITAAVSMQRTLVGTTASQVVDEKLQALKKEKADIDSKITIVREALESEVGSQPSDSSQPQRAPATNEAGTDGLTPPAGGAARTPSTLTAPAPAAGAQAAAAAVCVPAVPYADPPALLTDLVDRDVADAVEKNNATRAVASISKMVLYTILDAASPKSSEMVRGLEAYQYLGETARTDKQLGSAANSNGAVSAIEKPGFAQLLGFAVEHGGITKKNDGTNLTLSTSLYSLYTLKGGDTAATYERAGILNRIAGSATFAIDNQTNELANARRNNLSEWSVKARLFGDRSTRSRQYQEFWNSKIRPVIRQRLLALGAAIEGLSQRIDGYDAFERDLDSCLRALVQQTMNSADYKAASAVDRKKMLRDLMLGRLKSSVAAAVTASRLKLTDEVIILIERQYIPGIRTALDNLVKADKELKEQIDNLQKGPLGTFAYTNYRIPTGSDYSEAKFLFEQDKSLFRPLKFIGNLGMSFYNRPDPALNQKRLRDVSAALSFEGTSQSPFTEVENQSKITYSFVGRFERLFENRRLPTRTPDIGTFQFVMEIPFFKGLSLPLSATYANGTEEEKKNHFRFNFGMRLDTDKLFALLKAASSQPR
jgi:hypothetical protein